MVIMRSSIDCEVPSTWDFRRGTLSASGGAGTTLDTVTTLNTLSGSSKNWNLDAQGNWSSVTAGGSTQNRTANQENQYTAVGGTSLGYDSDGNLTSNENGDTQSYDAWDRLAHFTHRAGGGSVG
jgi:YD repeat-containing protein